MQEIMVNELRKNKDYLKNLRIDIPESILQVGKDTNKSEVDLCTHFSVQPHLIETYYQILLDNEKYESMGLPPKSLLDIPTYARLRPYQRKTISIELNRRIAQKKETEANGIIKFLAQFLAGAIKRKDSGDSKEDQKEKRRLSQMTPFGRVIEEFRRKKEVEDANKEKPIEALIDKLNYLKEETCEPVKKPYVMRRSSFCNISSIKSINDQGKRETLLKLNENFDSNTSPLDSESKNPYRIRTSIFNKVFANNDASAIINSIQSPNNQSMFFVKFKKISQLYQKIQ